jgi:pimeloyl-ACP methyl ester carboxylesterase
MNLRGKRRWWLAIAVAVIIVAVFGTVALELRLRDVVIPPRGDLGPPPDDLPFEPVVIPSDSGSDLRGWFAPGDSHMGGVALMHAIRANRRTMLDRARFLHRHGYAVLLFDFQAHGESPGRYVTFGHLESHDARAAIEFLRERVDGRGVGALGSSLGGAACILGETPLRADAVVIEAVYPDLEAALDNRVRMRIGSAARWVVPVLLDRVESRLGLNPADLRPVDAIARLASPLLVIAGTADRHTTATETRRLFDAAPEPKELWWIEGAAHVDFHRYAGEDYENTVLAFLDRYLGSGERAAVGRDP